MYGKLHASVYDGTLRQCWEAMAVFPHLITLCDCEGIIDMTPQALHDRTTLPLGIINTALAFLEQPDPQSRSPQDDGRRIVLLDEHRDWGWRIVNHHYYRNLSCRADKREKDRKRMADKRAAAKANELGGVAESRKSRPCKMQDASKKSADAPSIWDQAKQVGIPRSLLGKSIKEHGKEEVAKAVGVTILNAPADPTPYFLGCLPKPLPDDSAGSPC